MRLSRDERHEGARPSRSTARGAARLLTSLREAPPLLLRESCRNAAQRATRPPCGALELLNGSLGLRESRHDQGARLAAPCGSRSVRVRA